MGAEALEAAVFNWAQKRGVDLAELGVDIRHDEQEEGRIVCKCFGLTEPYLRRKIEELELKTIPDITNAIKAGGACMSCHHTPGGLQDCSTRSAGREPTTHRKSCPCCPWRGRPRPQPPVGDVALQVRQEGREGHRRVRPAAARQGRRRHRDRRHQGLPWSTAA